MDSEPSIMKTKKRNSKKWLECRRKLVSDYRTWLILCVVKLLLFLVFLYTLGRLADLNGESKSAALSVSGWLFLDIILLTFLKEIWESQNSIQFWASRRLTGDDTFHFLEVIPGKAFRIHLRENRIYKRRVAWFKRIIRESRRRKNG